MEEYLAFIEKIGMSIDGNYVYQFYFTYDTEIVWGEYFNICPCSIIPNLMPDLNSLSHKIQIIFPKKLSLVQNNMCFSMQDCIDGIIPIAFVDINEKNYLQYKNKPLFFPFGENKNLILEKCSEINCVIGELQNISNDNNEIDDIIDKINNNNDNFEDF